MVRRLYRIGGMLLTHCVKNKTLSDSTTDEILRLQGISWLKRKAISLGTVYISLNHYKDADNVEHIDIDQTVAGIPGSREERTLWWKERSTDDSLFGPVVGKSRRARLEDIENEYLTNGWLPDTIEQGLIQTYVESDTPKSGTTWIAEQVSRTCIRSLYTLLNVRIDLGFRGNQWGEEIRSTCTVHRTQGRGYQGEACLRLL